MSDPVVRVASMTVIDGGDLSEENATGHVHGICLKTGPPRRVGVELEWLVRDARDPALPVPAERIAAAVAAFGAEESTTTEITATEIRAAGSGEVAPVVRLPSGASPGVLPSGALLTTEPGGQL